MYRNTDETVRVLTYAILSLAADAVHLYDIRHYLRETTDFSEESLSALSDYGKAIQNLAAGIQANARGAAKSLLGISDDDAT